MRQSELEKKFEQFIVNRYSMGYQYWNRRATSAISKMPDFKHIWRENCFIETYHPRYHSFAEAVGRIAFFGARDCKMLVIWEAELEDEARLVDRIRVFEQAADSPGFFGMVRVANERTADEAVVWQCPDPDCLNELVARLNRVVSETTNLIARPLSLSAFQIECFDGERDMAHLSVCLTAGRLSIHKMIKGLMTSEPISIHEERAL